MIQIYTTAENETFCDFILLKYLFFNFYSVWELIQKVDLKVEDFQKLIMFIYGKLKISNNKIVFYPPQMIIVSTDVL